MARFFFWTTWMASTQRPGTDATYTNNWPHEPLLDHNPTPESIAWSVVSVIILLCGIGVLLYGYGPLVKRKMSMSLVLRKIN